MQDGAHGAAVTALDRQRGTRHQAVASEVASHRLGEGPCLDALTDGGALYADELAGDARWPRFGPQATAAGVRTVLAFTLPGDGTHGALNLYARYPQAFGVIDRAKGLLLSALAGLALSSAAAHDDNESATDRPSKPPSGRTPCAASA